MTEPLVSVIIPTYNGARFLGRAIRSVLNQTYSNLELIVVDDRSPDNTEEVVKQFNDPRLSYFRHEVNQGASAARGTGRRHSSGEIIAFLDQDDMFHPEKLEAHVTFLKDHPEVGFTYNPYFELVHSSEEVRTVWQPPRDISLAHLTLGFYLPPSSWVVRREWAVQEEIWDSHGRLNGKEIIICGRLFMAGCKFARIDRVLHSRGYHAGRRFKDLEKNCEEELICQETIFSDPRCPADVLSLRPIANMVINLMWANDAFNQNETALGQKLLRKALQANPGMFEGHPSMFMSFLMGYCVDDESQDYEVILKKLFSQFPPEVPDADAKYRWAIPRGYLVRGVRALIWNRPADADTYFSKALEHKCEVDEEIIQQATHELLGYELSRGTDAASEMLVTLCSRFAQVGNRRDANWLKGSYWVNKANQDYQSGRREAVPGAILSAVVSRPGYLFDRGVLATLVKSMVGIKSVAGR
ncbi:MAG: glycosyltransferase family 2 protein [Chloroflexi bacterium]|nr:glycosyltransferase family 2 protein [Chloroflexota bacterium]